ncbi:lysine-specific demethylase 5A-like isoform X4 [Haliotis rufescens]|uniref:lysine-specific demethylase 5A-like isoform X4 n=1 Tax=Haliotis rufescens TaxID=6454 RepID=UPI00201E8E66|nr:lysine-specific demethylase 5A-like isoform X4 [Haliotis rufescens]
MDDPYINFVAPPEAPVFTPTEEEFADPLGYIAKIRPIAVKGGICKIKPPPDWQPPFAVDVEKFKFVPRVQRLNELEAKSRIKLNFLDRLAKFWELQGCALRIPHVEKKLVDLFGLYKFVEEEGGMEQVSAERKWSKISTKLGMPTGKGCGTIVRGHYERILYPFFVFRKGDAYEFDKLKKVEKDKEDMEDIEYKPHKGPGKESQAGHIRKSKRAMKEEPVIDYSANSELKKLQFYGAGPKAAVPSGNSNVKEEKQIEKIKDEKIKTRERQIIPGTYADMKWLEGGYGQVDKYLCHMCEGGDGEEYMLLCDGCDDAFHTYCLIPPLVDVPKGDWRCPKCVKQACSRPQDPYGFEQSRTEYSLQSFGEMADNFKSNYFNMPVHMVPCAVVEKEFWRLVSCIEEDVSVQYGADIHASEMGSGFPTQKSDVMCPEDEEYVNSGWNLNNLPVLEQSVLCHINADISGMKIPWCYVGMCFSSFCWHNEDHWSYSINYLHWGEPKTWYGVPGESADIFERAMRQMAPELFEQAPDLLHQLTTIMNPNLLMAKGVPIVRTNQHAGEFVVTFPRAYHAGFNQGYNFAEAVNFCPADWLGMGRLCIDNYRSLHRQCVFSHEELICKMAADPDSLDLNLAACTHQDMLAIVEEEKQLRKKLLDMGVVEAEREAFELLPDDERQCYHCKTTCFLSGITCPCSPNKVVCLYHTEHICTCDTTQLCLRYRYTLDELPSMLHKLKMRAESFDNWNVKVKAALDAPQEDKLDLQELKDLVTEAEEKKFPDNELFQQLTSAVNEAEKCANVANQLVSKKVRTRNRQSLEGKYIAKLNLEELNIFHEQVISLPCVILEAKLVKELLDKVVKFQTEAKDALDAETPDSEKLEKLIEVGIVLDVDLPEIPKLKQVLQQAKWLDEVRNTLKDPPNVTLEVMRKLMESGVSLAPHSAVERAMADLQELLTVSERWEEKARICLQARPRHVMTTLEAIISEAKSIPAYLPNVCALKEAVRKAKEWTVKVEAIQNGDSYPYLDILENFVNKGRPIPVRLDSLPQVESQVAAAKSWRERTARTFLKKNSTYSLLEVLSPRQDIGMYTSGKNKKKKLREGERDRRESENNNTIDIKVAAFKVSEQREVECMRDLRGRNLDKLHCPEGEAKFCICRKGASGFMLQCELCKDWFHGTCVPLPKSANMKNKTSQTAVMQATKDMKFLCPLCLRSRRPRLETILSLLVSLQKLPVRLPEGEALQCLTERAMAWQDRARQALTTNELASALTKLSVLSQRMVEQAAREKTEKIINAELLKAANNPELQSHLASVTQSAFSGVQNGTPQREINLFSVDIDSSQSSIPMSPQSSQTSDDISTDIDTIPVSHGSMSSEHAYSSVSKAASTMTPRKHQRKSPLVPRQLETPVLELSEIAKCQLEELMMEGDLLEVSLDETQHIWRILQACQPRHEEKFIDFEDPDKANVTMKERGEKVKRIKKEKDKIKEKKIKIKRKKEAEDSTGVVVIKKIKEEVGVEKPKKKKMKIKDPNKEPVDSKEKENKVSGKLKPKEVGDKTKKDKCEKLKKKKKLKIKLEGMKQLGEKTPTIKKIRIKKDKSKDVLIVDEDDDEEENDEDCSAVKCLKPVGEEVNWVQCDSCEKWFHLLCVGLGKEEVSEDEEYVCFQCVQIKNGVIPAIKQEPPDELLATPDITDISSTAVNGNADLPLSSQELDHGVENMELSATATVSDVLQGVVTQVVNAELAGEVLEEDDEEEEDLEEDLEEDETQGGEEHEVEDDDDEEEEEEEDEEEEEEEEEEVEAEEAEAEEVEAEEVEAAIQDETIAEDVTIVEDDSRVEEVDAEVDGEEDDEDGGEIVELEDEDDEGEEDIEHLTTQESTVSAAVTTTSEAVAESISEVDYSLSQESVDSEAVEAEMIGGVHESSVESANSSVLLADSSKDSTAAVEENGEELMDIEETPLEAVSSVMLSS